MSARLTATATPGPGHGEITLAWTPAATGGAVKRTGHHLGGNAIRFRISLDLEPDINSYVFTGLDMAKTYEFKLLTWNAKGQSSSLFVRAVAPFADTVAPPVAGAAVNADTLTVTLDEDLDTGSAPAGSAFTLSVTPSGGAARTVAGTGTATLSGKTETGDRCGSEHEPRRPTVGVAGTGTDAGTQSGRAGPDGVGSPSGPRTIGGMACGPRAGSAEKRASALSAP